MTYQVKFLFESQKITQMPKIWHDADGTNQCNTLRCVQQLTYCLHNILI